MAVATHRGGTSSSEEMSESDTRPHHPPHHPIPPPPPPPLPPPPDRTSVVQWEFADDSSSSSASVYMDGEYSHSEDDADSDDGQDDLFRPVVASPSRRRRVVDSRDGGGGDVADDSLGVGVDLDSRESFLRYSASSSVPGGASLIGADHLPNGGGGGGGGGVGASAHSPDDSRWDGSFYFQQRPAGGAGMLPPHLAYWMQMGNGGSAYGHLESDLTLADEGRGGGGDGDGTRRSRLPPRERPRHGDDHDDPSRRQDDEYRVYPSRWIMLGYMSLLNLMSDWTCYSVAPIARMTMHKFGGDVDPEGLVTVFLLANTVASALEPAILGRLGLRRTILFGASLLMAGSIVKSGSFHSILVDEGDGESKGESWRLYLGFFLVGLSQPLYQCTPALLSASWFPENERTMATGVALNSNQLGIGCAFVFGTMLVTAEDDIMPYFGLLSLISTIAFVGVALQFDDAPPTPPSDSARVIRGDLEIKIPRWLPFAALGGFGKRESGGIVEEDVGNHDDDGTTEEKERRKKKKKKKTADAAAAVAAHAPVPTDEARIRAWTPEMQFDALVGAPSAGPTDEPVGTSRPPGHEDRAGAEGLYYHQGPVHSQPNHPLASPYHPPYHSPHIDSPRMGYSMAAPTFFHGYDQEGHYRNSLLESSPWYDDYRHSFSDWNDEGVEPIMTQLDHHLDIDIRDDQIVQQFKACFRRKGFSHCVVAFTTSGIIINTLSTFMDYLVTLNGAGREYVGIVGGTFQMLIMCSSLVFGGWTDASRKYYLVTLVMLTFGTFALAVCNVNLDSNAGGDLRWNLLVVAVLAGPLQPISTELGVEVVYPLSENTVLVIQQLFSNLLSALFIPVFKALRDVGTIHDESENRQFPHYTFSFYCLIVIFAAATCYFATFNGAYLRYEAEEAKKAKKEEERENLRSDLHQHHHGIGYGSLGTN